MERDITGSGTHPAVTGGPAGTGPDEAMPSGQAGDAGATEKHAAPPATGDQRVDQALGGLGGLADLPVSEHPPVFERLHGQLVEVLGELRSGPDAGARGRQSD